MSTEQRDAVIEALTQKFGSENIAKLFENEIYNSESSIQEYPKVAYEKLGKIMEASDRQTRVAIVREKEGSDPYSSIIYKQLRSKREIDNDRIVNPPQVQGGIFKCRKCKSDKTSHYGLQVRSSDEPATQFITCASCGNRWTE